jgi:6-phosphofructokinase
MSLTGNLLIAHGGGPTPVINASLRGVIEAARRHPEILNIYGARYGVAGLLNEELIDLGQESQQKVDGLSYTPASALGSCRKKLKEEDYPHVLEILKKYNIRYFFYNGGNDSMDTCQKIAALAGGYDIRVIGIPKTIDNDLEYTDHSPGFGSAARYAAISARELWFDVASLPIHVCILELMGRNAGWLTAASVLGKKSEEDGPQLVYLPERPFIEEEFLEDVRALHSRGRGVLVAVSEGLKDQNGKPLSDTGIVDGFGHIVPGGVAQHLSAVVMEKLGIKSRSEKPGLLGRTSVLMQSAIDREEAEAVGKYAVKAAVEGKSGYMVAIKRIAVNPYRFQLELAPLEQVANAERKFPLDWINQRGNGIKQEFSDYALPLIGDPLPDFVILDKVKVAKI